jgi:phospholipase C
MSSRRDFLKFAAALAGAGASELLPDSVQRAYAIEPRPGSTFLDAEHVVILMQENRSFDHTFGTLRGVRGFNDPRALRLANDQSVFAQTDTAGETYAPWRLDIKDTRVTWMGSLPHSRDSQVDAWNGGLHDGWLDAKRSGHEEYAHLPLTMGYYTRQDLPFYYALADAFTVCDQHYCSVMTSTSPNRCVFWTGTVRESQHPTARAHMRNEQIDPGGLTWSTFPERLQEAGVSWKSYQNELTRSELIGDEAAWLSNFGDNVLECFEQYNVEAYPGFVAAAQNFLASLKAEASALEAKLEKASEGSDAMSQRQEIEKVQSQIAAAERMLADSGETRYNKLTVQQRELHHRAFATNRDDPHYRSLEVLPFEAQGEPKSISVPRGDVLHEFRKDASEGKLPTISWLTAPERFSDHPSAPWFGAWYISEVMDILTKNPEVWQKTIFILTYDENDGYFDHAPSYVAADPKRPETGGASAGIDTGLEYVYREDELAMGVAEAEARSGPVGMGFRVPMIVASPWTRGGWVNSQLFDHSSTLQFLETFIEHRHGKPVHEENISAWRRAISGNLTSVFRPHDPADAQIDYVKRDPFLVRIAEAQFKPVPSGYRKLGAAELAQGHAAPESPASAHAAWMPKQEPGTRPACALPYELYAGGRLGDDGKHFELELRVGDKLHGARSAGAPFNVYLRNLVGAAGMQVATYAVRAGDARVCSYPLALFAQDRYEIEVHAPNGFYRCFRGGFAPQEATLEIGYEVRNEVATGNLQLLLRSTAPTPLTVEIMDHSYGTPPQHRTLPPGRPQVILLASSRNHGWYDYSLRTSEQGEIRFAGRVETGKSGITDPAMGGIA